MYNFNEAINSLEAETRRKTSKRDGVKRGEEEE